MEAVMSLNEHFVNFSSQSLCAVCMCTGAFLKKFNVWQLLSMKFISEE